MTSSPNDCRNEGRKFVCGYSAISSGTPFCKCLRKVKEKAPCFSAGMNPTPLPHTVFDVLNGCF